MKLKLKQTLQEIHASAACQREDHTDNILECLVFSLKENSKSVFLLNNFAPPVFLFDIDEEIESNWSRNMVYKTYMQAASPPLWSAHQVIFEFFFSFQKSKTSHFLFDLLIRFTAKMNLFTHWLHLPCPSSLTRSCSRQKWQNCPLAENHSKFLPKCSFFFTCRGKSNLLLNPNQ